MWGRWKVHGLVFPQFSWYQPAGKVRYRLFYFPPHVQARAFCLHTDLEKPPPQCQASQPTDVPGLSQPSASGCNEMMLLTQRGSVQKLLTIFCRTKRGERNPAHSRPCRDSAFLRGSQKCQRESATQAVNPLSWGKPHPPGSEGEKCDPGSSQPPLLDLNQRLWEGFP